MRLSALLSLVLISLFSFVLLPSAMAQDSTAQPPAAQPAASQAPAASPAAGATGGSADNTQFFTGSKNGLQKVTSDKWDWSKQWATMGDGFANLISCNVIAVPYNTDACPVSVMAVNSEGAYAPTTMLAYHGEGGGLIGSGSRMMAYMYTNRPASGVEYVANAYQNKFGLEPQSAYAQVSGSGAAVLKPIETLWQLSRNLAYLFFIFVFVTIGFMIMFRQKLNPQTVITVQNAVPGLVVGLILVTFSFFIAGLVLDLAFFLPQVLGSLLLQQTGMSTDAASGEIQTLLNTENVGSLYFKFLFTADLWQGSGHVARTTFELISGTVIGSILPIIAMLASCLNPIGLAVTAATGGVGALACAAVGGFGSTAGGAFILNAAIYIIILFGLLQALARLLFQLISAYVAIMIMTIFGPFFILVSTIPGNSEVFSGWWRQLLANALLFPSVFLLFILVRVILDLNKSMSTDVYGTTLPLLGGIPASFMQLLLAYGLLLAAPGINGILRDLLKAKLNTALMSAAGGNLKTGYGFAAAAGTFAGVTAYKGLGGGLVGVTRSMPTTVMGKPFTPFIKIRDIGTRLTRAGFHGTPPPKK